MLFRSGSTIALAMFYGVILYGLGGIALCEGLFEVASQISPSLSNSTKHSILTKLSEMQNISQYQISQFHLLYLSVDGVGVYISDHVGDLLDAFVVELGRAKLWIEFLGADLFETLDAVTICEGPDLGVSKKISGWVFGVDDRRSFGES